MATPCRHCSRSQPCHHAHCSTSAQAGRRWAAVVVFVQGGRGERGRGCEEDRVGVDVHGPYCSAIHGKPNKFKARVGIVPLPRCASAVRRLVAVVRVLMAERNTFKARRATQMQRKEQAKSVTARKRVTLKKQVKAARTRAAKQ